MAEVERAHDHAQVLDPDPLREREHLLDGRIADRKAAVGDAIAVDHDVAAELRATVVSTVHHVEGIRIIEPEREVVVAVGIESRDSVKALGHLMIALPELRSEPTARRPHEVRADERPGATDTLARPELEPPFGLERDERR